MLSDPGRPLEFEVAVHECELEDQPGDASLLGGGLQLQLVGAYEGAALEADGLTPVMESHPVALDKFGFRRPPCAGCRSDGGRDPVA